MSSEPAAEARWRRSDRVFSARLLLPNMRFIREHYGPEAEAELYRRIGFTRAQLEDPDLWVTYDTSSSLNRAMLEVTGDPDVMYRAGLYHAWTAEVGPWFHLARQLARPRDIYARLPAMTANFSKITHFELLDLSAREARIRFRVDAPFSDDPLYDQKRRGTLASFPMGLGLPPATVVEEQCVHRGDPACVYRVQWENRERRLAWLGLALVLAVALGALLGHGVAGTAVVGGALGAAAIAFLLLGLLAARRMGGQGRRLDEKEAAQLEHLLASYQEKAERLELLAGISDLLHRTHDVGELVRTATDLVRRHLGFDRVLFWMLEDGRLRAVEASGLTPEVAHRLGELWLPQDPDRAERDDVPLFGPLLERERGVRVTDVPTWRDRLSERGRQLLDLVRPGPFVAVPVRSGGAGAGVLAADRGASGGEVTDADLSMLEQVARQLGLALENVRLLESEREARERREQALLLERKLSLYLQPHVVEELRRRPDSTVPATLEQVAVLFVDVAGFSRVAERLPEAEVVAWLNVLFAEADRVVQTHGGIIDKRLGDGILAVFRFDSGGAAARAIAASVELHGTVATLDADLTARGLPPLRIRSGITFGRVIAGTIGTEVRYEYTVIGRTVNLAQRLQTLARPGETVVSPEAWEAAGRPQAQDEDEAQVHGIPHPVRFRRLGTGGPPSEGDGEG